MKLEKCIRVLADLQQINNCRAELNKITPSLSELAAVLHLAGNEVRMAMLYFLYTEEKLCVCDLSDIMDMKIPAISQHLRKMKDGGLISNEKMGQTIFYFIEPEQTRLVELLFALIPETKTLQTSS